MTNCSDHNHADMAAKTPIANTLPDLTVDDVADFGCEATDTMATAPPVAIAAQRVLL